METSSRKFYPDLLKDEKNKIKITDRPSCFLIVIESEKKGVKAEENHDASPEKKKETEKYRQRN